MQPSLPLYQFGPHATASFHATQFQALVSAAKAMSLRPPSPPVGGEPQIRDPDGNARLPKAECSRTAEWVRKDNLARRGLSDQ